VNIIAYALEIVV